MLFMLLSLGVLIAVIRGAASKPPPLEYIDKDGNATTTYRAEKDVYAPGEILVYRPMLVVRIPSQVQGLRQFKRIVNGKDEVARLCSGGSPRRYPIEGNVSVGQVNNIVTGSQTVPILVEAMPPGDYKLTNFLYGFGEAAGQIHYDVLFKIETPC